MTEKEFDKSIGSVDILRGQTQLLYKEVTNSVNNTLVNSVNTLVKNYEDRNKKFREYLELLREFNFSDNLLSPTDVFPGIRTIADTVDPSIIQQKTQQMKDISSDINTKSKEIEAIQNMIIHNLKNALNRVTELIISENTINDMNMDILKDLDSIYDVGQIKKSMS